MANPRESTPAREGIDGEAECDLTLVDAMLALTPEERLRVNDRMIQCIQELRHGFAARADDAARAAGGERD